MSQGLLRIHTTTGDEALPVANAHVSITDKDGNLLYEDVTDANGLTRTFSIDAPDVSLTLDPNYGRPAYSTVNVDVSVPGFVTEHISGVEIVDTQTAVLPVHMEPLVNEPNPVTDDYIKIPEIGLLSRGTNDQQGTEISQFQAPGAIPQVLVPDYITVHLGVPTDASARNIRVKFSDYIKNVASSEIYSTWPRESLLANIHAIVTFALNRIFTEWYRSRGYNFDITNSTQFDMAFREGGPIYTSISNLVDDYFNMYAHRYGFANPFFTSFCAGTSGAPCQHGGMSQWGTVTLANQGRTALEILRHYFPNDIILTRSNNVGSIVESFPGTALTIGSSGDAVRRMQNYLNRIRVNYPLIPRIENPNGVFGADTANAVRVFQQTFNLTADGIIGRATWNRITQIYVGIIRLAELDSEGIRISIGQNPPNVVLSMGSRGNDVLELQFILNYIAAYFDSVPTVIQDGVFDARTRNSVIEFQKTFNLPQDGVVGPTTWNKLYSVFRGIEDNVTVPPTTPPPTDNLPPYPGTPLKIGSVGENVRIIQEFLNVIRTMYPNIPLLTVDGSFGPATQAAVIAFQRQFLLTPDGIVGPTTWNKIMEQYQIAIGGPTEPLPPPEYFFYTVQAGDTLWLISHKFNTTVDAIKSLNGLTSDVLNIGQVLKIPGEEETPSPTPPPNYFEHIVQAGDTLWILAQRFGTTVDAIRSLNGLTSDVLNIGQVLRIPGESPTLPPTPPSNYFEHIVVNGDTLWLLAQRFGTTVDEIKELNGLTSNVLNIGQVLRIPGGVTYSRTIVIDAGHGGSDPGAVSGSRLEKDDNLSLALAVQRNLIAQNQRVIMTRSTDVFIPLAERSDISNRNNADLFVSLHRDFNNNPAVSGVSNYVYTMAPVTTVGYAQNVLNEIVNVGVQRNLGVLREDFSVLRNTVAPAMLVEMGFISNARDNELFDQNLDAYAAAITRGILESLGEIEVPTSPSFFYYTVQDGDSLWRIAQRFGTTVEAIKSLNGLVSDALSVGQVLRIPSAAGMTSAPLPSATEFVMEY